MCDYKTDKSGDNIKHIETKHSETLNSTDMQVNPREKVCGVCDFSSSHKSHLKKHKLINHIQFACPNCDFKAYKKCRLVIHIRSTHKSNRHKEPPKKGCNICEYKSYYGNHLKRHKFVKHGVISEKSAKYDYTTLLKKYLVKDMIQKPTTGLKEEESNHEKVNTDKTTILKYNCNTCDYKTDKRSTFIRHFQTKHEPPHFICDQCDYKANQEHTLLMHKQSQHEGITYDCTQCKYKGARKDGLLRHIEGKHAGVKYLCEYCDYRASWKVDLARHKQFKHKE